MVSSCSTEIRRFRSSPRKSSPLKISPKVVSIDSNPSAIATPVSVTKTLFVTEWTLLRSVARRSRK